MSISGDLPNLTSESTTSGPIFVDAYAAAATQFYSETIRCGLQDRIIGGLVDLHEQSWRIILLQSGEVELGHDDGTTSVSVPSLIWQPLSSSTRIRVRAGSTGAHLMLGERGLSNAVGRKPEAAELRVMAGDQVIMPLSEVSQTAADIVRAFDLLLREGQSVDPGSETIIEAQVRVLLVLLWRHATRAGQLQTAEAHASQILQRFRQLLEIHFRDRWAVGAYAEALGITSDRLHDTCTRVLGKPPLRLIHERTIFEAQSLLTRSSRTVDQISGHLGFHSSAQFSKFFRSIVGMPPGGFRRAKRSEAPSSRTLDQDSYADWP